MIWDDILLPLVLIAVAMFFVHAFSGPLIGLQIQVNP